MFLEISYASIAIATVFRYNKYKTETMGGIKMQLKLADNLVRLRREKQLTQEELADFLHVTKGSVSKWENRQSLPDVLMLPRLAVFFDVTVDELLGYETQLAREQIEQIYIGLCRDFTTLPVEEVLDKIQTLIHRYYSCYPFLLQISILYLNHLDIMEEETRRRVLLEAVELCERISSSCEDIGIVNDAVSMKALLALSLGRSEEVIELLQPVTDPCRLGMNNNVLLIQAYHVAGMDREAGSFAQISMYVHLVTLIGTAVQYISLKDGQPDICDETIHRVDGVLRLYRVDELHPNLSAQFYYQCALNYAGRQMGQAACDMMDRYVDVVLRLFSMLPVCLHGDDYFNCLDGWIDRLTLGGHVPRDTGIIRQSAVSALKHPVFEPFQEMVQWRQMERRLMEGVNRDE